MSSMTVVISIPKSMFPHPWSNLASAIKPLNYKDKFHSNALVRLGLMLVCAPLTLRSEWRRLVEHKRWKIESWKLTVCGRGVAIRECLYSVDKWRRRMHRLYVGIRLTTNKKCWNHVKSWPPALPGSLINLVWGWFGFSIFHRWRSILIHFSQRSIRKRRIVTYSL